MFWGLNLKPNRKYSQTTEKSFHISQAALDSESSQGGPTQIFISSENQRFLVCTLRKEVCEQVMLDLNFSEGNEICFQSIGSGNVTLSGYVMEDMGDDFMNGDEEEEDVESGSETEEVDLRNTINAKKSKNKKTEKAKAPTKTVKPGADEEDDDEEEDSDFDAGNDDDDEDDDDGEEDENDEDDDDEEDEEEEDEEEDSEDQEIQEPKSKQAKLEKSEKQNGVPKQKDNQVTEKKSKKEQKKEKQQKQQKPQEKQQKAGVERVLSGGVKIVDLSVGNGPEAKPGTRPKVFYEGRLLSNNKVFDSLKSGGFKFCLGRGEVIKGWDVGIVGMKVNGKRRITCPPHMAYGSRGSPPAIPPNSTLVFDVELKAVN